jgi:NADPH-dependent 2,4-dienoyl-CoA reductase/sulfur reductase-like enzyme
MAERGQWDVLVVGGGPAGVAAAVTAAERGAATLLVDDNPTPGGQIWRGETRRHASPLAERWLARLDGSGVTRLAGARVVDAPSATELLVESRDGARTLRARSIVLATGARERFVPFPGWTLPQVLGAGGAQALVKTGWLVAGQTIVVAGSGPLLLAVADLLRAHGARVPLVAEQATPARVAAFGARLVAQPAKLAQAMALRLRLARTRYRTGCWVESAAAAEGRVRLRLRGHAGGRELVADRLACGFGLVPNLELARMLGCAVAEDGVRVDAWQQTSVAGVLAAGEATGVGGAGKALVEGRVAGLVAAGRREEAATLAPARAREQRFARRLEAAFALRPELRALTTDATLVCRCEDVAFGRVRAHRDLREAKLQTRCGMGPCQGRVCGPSLEFLLGWGADTVRPPLFATELGNLASVGEEPDF